nr:immunoglobulin light chain junction region [Macaca mulatta]MOX48058.1 immunoglobulin light chain junction region [Macaca mulatta]MOX50719.1 immunoglobulin light chain junction region [Macaca mulatta]
CQQGFNTPYTF